MESITVASIEAVASALVEARRLVERFQTMIRKKTMLDLDPWITKAQASLIASFDIGIMNDRAAVSAAIAGPWSNGQTEGAIRIALGASKINPALLTSPVRKSYNMRAISGVRRPMPRSWRLLKVAFPSKGSLANLSAAANSSAKSSGADR
jgi:hypothetical protein